MPVVTAFSVSEQITNVGSYAGLASILGLAVLSLLYFGQARELKRLRDWAGRAPERTAELQEQANAAAAQAAAQRRPAAQAAGTPATRAPAAAPATAAGVAARPVPATQAATAAGAAGSVPPPGTPGAPAPGSPAPAGASGEGGPVTWAPNPAPATGTPANGTGQETQALPSVPALPTDAPLPAAVPSVAASAPIGPDGPPTDDSPVPLRQVNAAAGAGLPRRRATPEPVAPPVTERSRGGERSGGRRVGLLAGGAAALLLVIVLATQVLGGGGDEQTASTPPSETGNTIVPPESTSTAAAPTVSPADYKVFVLNGTTQNGIAAQVAGTLETAGYVSAGTGNAAVSTAPVTEIFFTEGKKRGANAVAKELGVKAANIKPADPGVTANAPGADVVVQIGADKATP